MPQCWQEPLEDLYLWRSFMIDVSHMSIGALLKLGCFCSWGPLTYQETIFLGLCQALGLALHRSVSQSFESKCVCLDKATRLALLGQLLDASQCPVVLCHSTWLLTFPANAVEDSTSDEKPIGGQGTRGMGKSYQSKLLAYVVDLEYITVLYLHLQGLCRPIQLTC